MGNIHPNVPVKFYSRAVDKDKDNFSFLSSLTLAVSSQSPYTALALTSTTETVAELLDDGFFITLTSSHICYILATAAMGYLKSVFRIPVKSLRPDFASFRLHCSPKFPIPRRQRKYQNYTTIVPSPILSKCQRMIRTLHWAAQAWMKAVIISPRRPQHPNGAMRFSFYPKSTPLISSNVRRADANTVVEEVPLPEPRPRSKSPSFLLLPIRGTDKIRKHPEEACSDKKTIELWENFIQAAPVSTDTKHGNDHAFVKSNNASSTTEKQLPTPLRK